MAEERFNTVLDDCITSLANGESLADVLGRYPEFEAELSALLESGLIVPELQGSDAEVAISQARVTERFEAALSAPITNRPNRRWWRILSLSAAVLAIVLFVNVALAQNSLPSDWNYGIKRSSETVFLLITSGNEPFAERRLDETRSLLALGRAANVTFQGEIFVVNDSDFSIAELAVPIEASADLLTILQVTQRVRIKARTTVDGRLIAQDIEILREVESDAEIIVSPSPTINETATHPSATVIATAEASPSYTMTFTLEPSRTTTPSPTVTETTSPTPTLSMTPTEQPLEGDNQAECVVSVPDGWITYVIQSGDTLFALAVRSGTSLETVSRVNCITDPALISVGQIIYLPLPPQNDATEAVSATSTTIDSDRPAERPTATTPPVRPTATPTRSR